MDPLVKRQHRSKSLDQIPMFIEYLMEQKGFDPLEGFVPKDDNEGNSDGGFDEDD